MWYSVALSLCCRLGEKCYNCLVMRVLHAYINYVQNVLVQ